MALCVGTMTFALALLAQNWFLEIKAPSAGSGSAFLLGVVMHGGASVLLLAGLQQACVGEVLRIAGTAAIVLQVVRDSFFSLSVGALVILATGCPALGALAFRTRTLLALFAGAWLVGCLLGPDGASVFRHASRPSGAATRWLIEAPAPGIVARKSVSEPLASGILAVDAMVPVGRGQRELVVGDRQTGKTAIGLDTPLNQSGLGVLCFLAAVGQKATSTFKACLALASHGAFWYASVWMSSASASAVSQYLAPYTACGAAEFFMWARRSPCFVCYDDLSRHAGAYRELSLLLRRPPGREAFPGEIFFVHSRLLERSCKLHFGLGGGSITAFPVIETLAGDVSGYIVSNVISITDGQIFLSTDLFLSRIRPAVDVGLSVTRVGSAAQTASMKQVGGAYKIELAQYFELQAFSQFASDIGAETQLRLARGVRLVALLTQSAGNPLSTTQQVRALCLANQGFYPRSCFVRSGTQELRGLRVLILTLPEWLSIGCNSKSICSSLTKSLQP